MRRFVLEVSGCETFRLEVGFHFEDVGMIAVDIDSVWVLAMDYLREVMLAWFWCILAEACVTRGACEAVRLVCSMFKLSRRALFFSISSFKYRLTQCLI